jgi:flagellar biosynthesis regulator FlaF
MEKKKISGHLFQVILSSPYFWSAVATVAVIIWTGLKGWFSSVYAPLTIPIILLVIGLAFYIINQIQRYRHKRNINYQTLITKWLLDYHYLVKKASDYSDKELWEIECTCQPENLTIKIAIFKDTPTYLTLGIIGKLSKQEQEDLVLYTSPINSTLVEEMQMEMNRLGVEYRDICHPLQHLELTRNLPLGDISLDQIYLYNEIIRMRHAFALLTNVVKKYKKLHPI